MAAMELGLPHRSYPQIFCGSPFSKIVILPDSGENGVWYAVWVVVDIVGQATVQ